MAYDEQLADRGRNALSPRKGLRPETLPEGLRPEAPEGLMEKKVFGGLSFMLRGNMCCGVIGEDLVVRVGPDQHEQLLAEPHARPMDFTGRSMKGFVYVGPGGYRSDEALARWVKRGVDFALSLPSK